MVKAQIVMREVVHIVLRHNARRANDNRMTFVIIATHHIGQRQKRIRENLFASAILLPVCQIKRTVRPRKLAMAAVDDSVVKVKNEDDVRGLLFIPFR